MGCLTFDNVRVEAPLIDILKQLRLETTYLKDIDDKHSYIQITCPFHKNGAESRASCGVFVEDDDPRYKYGTFHCFTCHEKGSFLKLTAKCLHSNIDGAKEWLKIRYGKEVRIEDYIDLKIADEKPVLHQTKFLDESILKEFEFYHPYMWTRKLSKEVVDRFQIGYDRKLDAITFPVFDQYHRLVMVTKRCVNSKKFFIPYGVEKPVYLLDYALQDKLQTVFVCESQINTLYCYTNHMPAIGLFGTGSPYQYDILKKCGINHFILALDGDEAGMRGMIKFMKHMPKHIMIDVLCVPQGKDVNDLSPEELKALPIITDFEWKQQNQEILEKLLETT